MKTYLVLYLLNIIPIIGITTESILHVINANNSLQYSSSAIIFRGSLLILEVAYSIYVIKRTIRNKISNDTSSNAGQTIGLGLLMFGSAIFAVTILFLIKEDGSPGTLTPLGYFISVPFTVSGILIYEISHLFKFARKKSLNQDAY